MNLKIRRDILEDGVILSTVRPPFMAWFGTYETGITFDNQKTWVILEGYDTVVAAVQGHEKYKSMSIDELKALEPIG